MKTKANYLIAATFISTLLATTAMAGSKQAVHVNVNAYNFSGSIGTARNDTSGIAQLGCIDYGTSAFCFATNAAGAFRSCSTSNATHVLTLRGIDDSSWISVNFNGGTCTSAEVRQFSKYEPKEK